MSGPLVTHAEAAGLRHVSTSSPGIGRRRFGRGYRYLDPDGRATADPATLDRIRRMAIPPAWREVWICADPSGHLQAVGKDARDRTQYLYHPEFRAAREQAKFEHLIDFARALPTLRRRVAADMARPGLGREKVLATVVHLLEATMIRVGNRDYAAANRSYGLTTLLNRHVSLDGSEIRFNFKGKGGKTWRVKVQDRRAARIVRGLQDLPGQVLFQYADEEGEVRAVASSDVNAYLAETSGAEVTAKDFRTWAGTLLAAVSLMERVGAGEAPSQRAATAVIAEVAGSLGNTAAICRKCYVHPDLIEAYLAGDLSLSAGSRRRSAHGLDPDEAALLRFLQRARARGAGRAAKK